MVLFTLKIALALVGLIVVGLAIWRLSDLARDARVWADLLAADSQGEAVFDPAMVADLPEPARRYFAFTIAPGTAIAPRAILTMTGEIGLGTKDAPNYRPMHAKQVLHPPHGLLWKMSAGALSGSDAATAVHSWTRFWLFHLIPVVRAADADHLRSAFGRVAAEAPIWSPAALLPSDHVSWEAPGPNVARVTLTNGDLTQTVDITLRDDGAPTQVEIARWSNANPEKIYRLQPFGGTLSVYKTFDGYTLPTRVEGGNHFGTPDYFPFFRVDITALELR